MPAEVVECDVADPNIVEGESAEIVVVVQNTGLQDDSVVVDILLDGSVVDTFSTPLVQGGQTITETRQISPTAGNYQVEVDWR